MNNNKNYIGGCLLRFSDKIEQLFVDTYEIDAPHDLPREDYVEFREQLANLLMETLEELMTYNERTHVTYA